MRALIWSILCFLLTQCAYYGDLHSHGKAYTPSELNTKHHYGSHQSLQTTQWWRRFHDPELNQLIAISLSDSPTIQTAKARIERAVQLAMGASANLWPSVDFSGYGQRQRFSQFGLIPPPFNGHTYNIAEAGLNFNYEFDFFGKNRELVASKNSEACAAYAELKQAELIMSAAVANTYFQLQKLSAEVQLAKKNWSLNNRVFNIIKNRAQHGIDSDIPVKTIEANLQNAKLMLEQYKQAEAITRHQLAVLLGKNPLSTQIETKHFAFKHYHVAIPANLPASLLANRPDIEAAKARTMAASNLVNVAKARFFPDINLNALFSYQSVGFNRLFDVQSQNNAITGAIDLPIFDAGQRRADLGVRYAEYDLAVNHYNQTLLFALQEVADYLAKLRSLNREINAGAIAVKATKRNYQLFTHRYDHGISDYVKVLDSHRMAIQRQSEQLELEAEHLQAMVGLIKALGGSGTRDD